MKRRRIMTSWRRWVVLGVAGLAGLIGAPLQGAEQGPVGSAGGIRVESIAADEIAFVKEVRPFLQKHCFACHDAREAQAGLRLDRLGADFLAGDHAERWREVIDRINLGEMPPEDEPRPDPDEALAVVEWVGRQLTHAERESRMAGGKLVIRRLNREEYANTVGDLLRLDSRFVDKLKELLPADGKAEGFDRIGSALFFDQTQMQETLRIAELIAEEAIRSAPPELHQTVWQAEAYRRPPADRVKIEAAGLAGAKHEIPSGPHYYRLTDHGFETWGGGPNNNDDGWIGIPSGPTPGLTNVVTQDGYYRIRAYGWGFPGERGTPIELELTYANRTPIESVHRLEIRGTREEPGESEAVVYLRAGQPGQNLGFKLRWNGIRDIRLKNPDLSPLLLKRLRTTGALQKARAARDEVEIARLSTELEDVLGQLASFDGPEYIPNEAYDLDRLPRLGLDRIEVEGPILPQWPPASHAALGLTEAIPDSPEEVRRWVFELLPAAFRRPASREEVESVVAVIREVGESPESTPIDAIRMGLQVILCSPGFVYLGGEDRMDAAESSGELTSAVPAEFKTDYALASRLSYFLWSSRPDEELLRLAAEGKLRDPATLEEQVARMLNDAKSQRFVESFAGQWLSVDQFGSVMPANSYRDYDEALEAASRREPIEFFSHVLAEDLAITNFLDSDFLLVNERLARHYGIEGVTGDAFRPVKITAEHHRGGVLGMAGLLTLLADGTRTLPVRRAAWVLESLLHDPPAPPPPNAGEIQPNTRGEKLTVRERLALHRDEPTCASCHAKLDGYGLALENYDAIGAWRTHQNGEGFRPGKSPQIDASGRLKSGREFADLEGFKAALLAEKSRFTRAFCEKLLTYALGRPVGLIDRETIESLQQTLENHDDRIRPLVHAVVRSPSFRGM